MTFSIKNTTLWSSQKQGAAFFHPKTCLLRTNHNSLLMTMQTINGGDYFGPVQFSSSGDSGISWLQPELIPGMGRIPVEAGLKRVFAMSFRTIILNPATFWQSVITFIIVKADYTIRWEIGEMSRDLYYRDTSFIQR